VDALNPAHIQIQLEGPEPPVRGIPKGAPYPVAALGPLQELEHQNAVITAQPSQNNADLVRLFARTGGVYGFTPQNRSGGSCGGCS
jgi:hypothetical protein